MITSAVPANASGVFSIAEESAAASRADGSVWCWGFNTNRQLGDGTRDNRFEPVMVMGTAAP